MVCGRALFFGWYFWPPFFFENPTASGLFAPNSFLSALKSPELVTPEDRKPHLPNNHEDQKPSLLYGARKRDPGLVVGSISFWITKGF